MVGTFNPKRLERAMQRKGFTPADLAYEMRRLSAGGLKTNDGQIYRWLAGTHAPRVAALSVAARALDVTLDSLLESDDDEEPDPAMLLQELREVEMPAALRRSLGRALSGARS